MHALPDLNRILVIDDSALVRSWAELELFGAGFQVLCVESGRLGLEALATFQPDVVLCDLNMPEMSGLDVVKALRQCAPEVPVVIHTEQAEVPSAVQALRLGACGYVVKNDDPEPMRRELDTALQYKQLWAHQRRLEEANAAYQRDLEKRVAEKTAEIADLQRQRAQAEKMAALGTLVAGVAHEINNPLAVVLANLRWLATMKPEDPSDPEEARTAVSEAVQCGERIQRIVRDLRRVAHPGTAGACLVPDAIQEALIMIRPQTPPTVRLEAELPLPELSASLSHDGLVTVISNLLHNALHAVEAKPEGVVRLTTQVLPEGSVISVEDNGVGIPPEHLAQVRDPFFTTKPPGRGTGLGLSLVDRLVREAGGKLEIHSCPGEGTTVQVHLPLAVPGSLRPRLVPAA